MSKRNKKHHPGKQANRNTKSKKGVKDRNRSRPSKQRQAIDRAVHYHNSGDLSQAEGLCQQVLAKNPQQPDALHLLGVVAYQTGKHDQAIQWITKALVAKPDFTEAHTNLGRILKNQGRLEDAAACFRNALAIKPNDAEAHLNFGLILQDLGKFQDAAASYHKAISYNPNHAVAHHNLGTTLQLMRQYEQAEASFRKAIAIKPDFAAAHNGLGHILQDLRQPEKAVESCRQALAIRPNDVASLNNLGNALFKLGRSKEAATSYQQAITLKPDCAEAHNNLGRALQELGQLEEAVASCRRALTIDPDFLVALNNLGKALLKLGQREEAAASYQRAIAINPDYTETYINQGNLLRELGRPDDAIISYHKALAIEPNHARAHGKIGNILQELGQLEDAIASYRQALTIEPDYAEAYNNLGNTLQELGKLEEAAASYHRSIAVQPNNNAMAHSNLGSLLTEQGKYSDAVASHRRAIAYSPKEDQYWNSFSKSLRYASFSSVDESLCLDLLHLLERQSVSPRNLVLPVLSALRQLPDFSNLLAWAHSDQSKSEDACAEAAETLSTIPLFLRLIELALINDVEVESMLTSLRRGILQRVLAETNNQKVQPFSIALALHCFTNEYVFYESAEETKAVENLQKRITALLEDKQDVPSPYVIAIGAYRPLHRLPFANMLCERKWPDDINRLLVRQIEEPELEHSIRAEISGQTSIEDAVSQTVRDQYEENPYPRWVKTQVLSKARSIASCLKKALPTVDLGDYQVLEKPEILIAGCGTGQQSLWAASRYKNSNITAVDLSLSSLSYAVRKTREIGYSNIEYSQADILELGSLQRQFDLIECTGVLHHLEDPLAGWRVLADILRPNGFMKIGLYSELARRLIVQCRALIAERGFTANATDIRQFRRDLLSEKDNPENAKLFGLRDFFGLSDCRDLLFHVQEHRFTLVQIDAALQSLGLKFLGFEMADQRVFKRFEAANSSTTQAFTSLSLWHQYELENPDTFLGMYQFWCQKL